MSEEWINTYDAVFFVTISTLLFGCFGIVIKYCLKSKCDNIKLCCGLIQIHRNVELETQEEMKAMELGIKEDEEEKRE
jgi:hypothetical protein